MTRTIETYRVESGEIVSGDAGWVYAWREVGVGERSVVYVGATRLHPVARAEKHLRDENPAIGRLRARYPARGGDLAKPHAVQAVELSAGSRRALVKAMVAWLASEAGLLSPRYCGEPTNPPPEELTSEELECARALVAALA